MKLRVPLPLLTAFLLTLAGVPGRAFAISDNDMIASKGTPVKADPAWPAGVVEIINDPTRGSGWHPWFSECPNDLTYFEMDIRETTEINRIARKLAKIKDEKTQIRLDPAAGAAHANNAGAVFSLGNQALVTLWFLGLRSDAVGVRRFGVSRFLIPPDAQPPTLTLYVGHQGVDVSALDIPASVEVVAGFSESYKTGHPNDPAVRVIERFVATHRVKRIEAGIVEQAD
jgi:hypothetical protein